MWPELEARRGAHHSPSEVQPGQSGCRSLHVDLHASHVTGHVRIMNSGFSLHSPLPPQPGQSAFVSLHSGVHSPQLVGQMRSIDSGLASHSPAVAHAPHDVSVSLQTWVHTPHESGQISIMYRELSPVHSPSRAQFEQSTRLSLQMPEKTTAARAARRVRSIAQSGLGFCLRVRAGGSGGKRVVWERRILRAATPRVPHAGKMAQSLKVCRAAPSRQSAKIGSQTARWAIGGWLVGR